MYMCLFWIRSPCPSQYQDLHSTEPWFHGHMDGGRQMAERLIYEFCDETGGQDGTFLVRPSDRFALSYTLSFWYSLRILSNSGFFTICILTNCICSLARSFPRVSGVTGGSSTAAFVRAHKRDAFTIIWPQTCTFPAWFPWSSTTERTHYAARILSCVSLML